MAPDPALYNAALADFQKARRKAAMEQLLARFSGRSTELLSYEEVRQQLRATNHTPRGLQDIPLDKIVGSVGRYKDFTRNFLPRQDAAEHRWAAVKTAVDDMTGVPPIEVYQLGEAYFVIDGNHRVSVARQNGEPTISAYVTQVKTRVPLMADDDPEEIICKSRYAEFLERTNLDQLRPSADLLTTLPGHYRLLQEHIDVHRYYLGIEQERFIPEEEAVASWYDNVYLPVIQLVREQGILRYFPGYTETDMYVLLAEYRAELAEALGWEIPAETAVTSLPIDKRSPVQALVGAVLPTELENSPPPGTWRLQRLQNRPAGRLFDDILLPLGSDVGDLRALERAVRVAKACHSRLLGLHIIDEQKRPSGGLTAEEVRAEFERRCAEEGVVGQFAIENGRIAQKIIQRAVYADGLIAPLNHPPETVSQRFSSGMQLILRHCPRPILTVPTGEIRPLQHALLAYGGNQTTAKEALFVATYLATYLEIKLSVLTVGDKSQTDRSLAQLQEYLQQAGVQADYYAEDGEVEQMILQTSATTNADFLIAGGPAYGPLRALLLGSTINRIWLEYDRPILICR